MKKILGLDLGANSIGWAVVNEAENGNRTTFETYRLRAKAATTEISLAEFARVLLQINKKRGYKSSRKAKSTEARNSRPNSRKKSAMWLFSTSVR